MSIAPSRRARRGCPPPIALIGSLLAALAGLCSIAPAALAAPATGSVTVVGETGSWVTGGHAYRFDSDTGSVSLSGGYPNGPSVAVVQASGDGTSFSLSFAAPAGQTLQTGEYASATRYPFETTGQAGIDVSGSGGCDQEFGSFDVRDVHFDGSGTIDRLWLLYQVRCEGQVGPSVFGEVRLGEPADSADPYAEPTTVSWPGIDLQRPARVVPVRIFAGASDRTVASVALTGSGAGDYAMRLDQCTGQALAAGTSCDVFPRYTPTAPGSAPPADLVVTMTDGSVVDVPLAGFAYGGATEMALESDQGDYIGGGVSSFYDESSADITASGTRESLSFSVVGDDGTEMSATFVPGHNDILVPGSTYTAATRYPFNNEGTGLSVWGNGRGCNELSGQFTVTDINFDPQGNLLDAGVTFVQHCEKGTPALRGIFEWRAPKAAVLAPWSVAPPTISGAAQVGAILEADPGTWAPADVATTYAFQWLRCDADGAGCNEIPAATAPTYTPTAEDAQQTLRVRVSAENAGGPSEDEPATSAASAPVAPAATPVPPPSSTPSSQPAARTAPTSIPTPSPAAAVGQTTAANAATTPSRLAQTVLVPAHQSRKTVAAVGLLVTVSCTQDCSASVSLRGAPGAKVASATARVRLGAGRRMTLHVRLHGASPRRLTLTASARQVVPPGASAPTVTRHIVLR